MKLKYVLTFAAPLMLVAGAALAANSGVATIDNWSNMFARISQAGGFAGCGIGLLAAGHHFMTGNWGTGLMNSGGTFVWGDTTMNYTAAAPQFGGTGAALIHPAAHAIVTHPATAHVIHAASKLVS